MLVPGDREVSEKKLARLYFPAVVCAASTTRTSRGSASRRASWDPQGFRRGRHRARRPLGAWAGSNWVTGANQHERHVTGANLDRDFRVDAWDDLVQIRDGDRCPVDGGRTSDRAVDRRRSHLPAGHDTTRSPSRPTFQAEDGHAAPVRDGVRTGSGSAGSWRPLVEQRHDDAGMIWPKLLAPFEVVVIMANADAPAVIAEAERIYSGARRPWDRGRPRRSGRARRGEVRRRRPDRLSRCRSWSAHAASRRAPST